MPTRKSLLASLLAIFCAACAATPVSSKAARVTVHRQDSTLLANCKSIGPVEAEGSNMPGADGFEMAKRHAREKAADLGADTIAVTDMTGTVIKATVQAVALRCY